MTEDLVSIIVPLYNKEKYLKRCLDSLISQTYTNLEIIIIDDGSTDKSPQIANNYQKIDNRIIVKHSSNQGVSSAKNKALAMVTGKYVMFVDPDDYVANDYVEKHLQFANAADLVISDAIDINEDGTLIHTKYKEKNGLCIVDEKFNWGDDFAHYAGLGCLYKRDKIHGIRFYNYSVGEDTLFYAEALHKARSIYKLSYKGYYYVQYSNSLSHGHIDKKKLDELDAWISIANVFQDRPYTRSSIIREYSIRIIKKWKCILYENNDQELKDHVRNHLKKYYKEAIKSLKNKPNNQISIFLIRYFPVCADIFYELKKY